MGNRFIHVELNTTDLEKAKEFYGRLFDWQFEDMEMGPTGTYTMIKTGADPGGGMLRHPNPAGPSMWLTYVLVDDIQAATQKAKSLGAEIMVDITEVSNIGTMSIIVDPTGASIALWKPKSED
jgi:uncharacterized protein